jgi:hypothetical protein
MKEIPEDRLTGAYTSMKHTHEYITGVKEQLTRYAEHVHVDEHILDYVMNAFKYMQDWLEEGIKELEPFVGDDKDV